MNIKTLFTITTTAAIVIFAACKKDKFVEVAGVCPIVVSTNPPNGATGVPLDQVITATFNEKMDPASITELTFIVEGSVVPGKVTYSDMTASFTPDARLLDNHTYTGRITTKVKDPMGNHLQEEYVWTFSTGLLIAPMVISTDPANLETDVPLNKTITAKFSMPMNPASLDTSFKLMQGSTRIIGVLSHSDSDAYFIPANPLNPGTVYTATISTGATSATGVKMQTDYIWTFTTYLSIAPFIIDTDPADNSTGVALNKVIYTTFNMAMDGPSFTNTTYNVKQGITNIPGSISYAGNVATFSPNSLLTAGTTYTVTVTTGVKNSFGVQMAKDSVWTFTTGFLVAPTVISTDPVANATNVVLNKSITATFSVPMNATTINSSTFLLKQGTTTISGAVSHSGSVATFTPSSNLQEGKTYTATITTGAKDLAGTSLVNNYTWNFTTLSIPVVISTDPANLATGVALNKIISATFNMAMNPATLNNLTFTLLQGSTPVAGGVGYSGNTVAFAPTVDLLPGTLYTATIKTGAKNLAGIGIANDYVWTFTTGVIKAPTVISTDPANLATGVALNKIISVTFSELMNTTSLNITSFLLKTGTTSVTGTVYMSGTTAYFKPTVNLLSGKTYTATITTDAKNVAGVKMANNYVWTFSTKAPLGPIGPDLAGVARFGIIAGTAVSNNAGFSKINNLDVGIYPGARSSITGFPPAVVINGAIYASDDVAPPGVAAMLLKAKNDLTAAYLFAEGATSPAPAIVSGDQGGKTLAPGIYKSSSTLLIQSGDLTLDAQGDVNAVWIFQIGSAFTTVGGAGGNIILSGEAQAKNIYWQVGSSATIGDYTKFKGNILALTTITMGAYSQADGRMLARNGAVTMTSTNIINKP
jgi:hypothetical protein